MTRYRLPALALLVTALLAVVAVVARGRPLAASAGRGNGLPTSFWDYVFTSVIIVAVLAWLVILVASLSIRPDPRKKPKPLGIRNLQSLAIMLVIALLLVIVSRHHHFQIHIHPTKQRPPISGTVPSRGHHGHATQPPATSGRHFRWNELAIVLGLLAVAGAVLVARRAREEPRRLELPTAPEALAAALDESLDDLRADPDLRRAIVAAYARMETALAGAGVPRRPSEAPLEYLERALVALDTSGAAVRRLTDLFEWARFSQHEPDAAMRDEAVDALEAVRDELRAAEPVTA